MERFPLLHTISLASAITNQKRLATLSAMERFPYYTRSPLHQDIRNNLHLDIRVGV